MPKFRALRDSFHDDRYYKAGEVYVFGSKKPPTKHFAALSAGETVHGRYTNDQLMEMSKQTLVALAAKERIQVTMRTKKTNIVEMILSGDVVDDTPQTLQEVANAETPAAKILMNPQKGKKGK